MSYTEILETEYGRMLVNRHDINQTGALRRDGRAVACEEIEQLNAIVRERGPDAVVADVGANFGTFSLALAKSAALVLAFEPQRIIFNMLMGSVALNAVENVYGYNLAVGDQNSEIVVPWIDYHRSNNFGSLELCNSGNRRDYVKMIRLDSLALPRLDVLKIDVEGMELEVLVGARGTITRCHPAIFVEVLKCNPAAVKQELTELGYAYTSVGDNLLCKHANDGAEG